jgi:hypothetical protein
MTNNYLTGTYFSDPNHNNQVVEIIRTSKNDPNNCQVDEGGYVYEIDRRKLNPILLDQLWFKKFGFSQQHENSYYKVTGLGDGQELHLAESFGHDYEVVIQGSNSVSILEIAYVHELQIMWRGITGNDLKKETQ